MVTGLVVKRQCFIKPCLHTKIALSMEEYAFYRCAMCMNQVYFRKKREKSKKRSWQEVEGGGIISKSSARTAKTYQIWKKELKRFEKRCWQGEVDVLIYKSCRETALNKKTVEKSSLKIKQLKEANKTRWYRNIIY